MPSIPGPFSTRTAWDTTPSDLAQAIAEARASGRPLIDLTLSNPTACGFTYDSGAILAALTDPAALRYDPIPQGLLSAREAVAGYYASHNARVDPGQILLTTSTSEAYSFLFRLLCDPGDEVLVAEPGYPLFSFLADLDSVHLRPYPLFFDFGWWIDFASLERAIGPRTRAILLIHPNNPTGHPTSLPERHRLDELCAARNLALIVDEVFLDYSLESPIESFATGPHPALTFVLSGLSKIAALPQMKVAWLSVFGPAPLRDEALTRLEIIADTMLSLSAPAQHALPAWLESRELIVPQITARVRANLATLTASGLPFLHVQAGWNAILRLPTTSHSPPENLIRTAGIVVHPGSFYGISGQSRVVVSLIVPAAHFQVGTQNLVQWIEPNQLTPGDSR